MRRSDLVFIRDAATAVLWKIEDLIRSGQDFEGAKAAAIAAAQPAWRHWHLRSEVQAVCMALTPADLSKSAVKAMSDRVLERIEQDRGYPASWIERLLYKWTGMTL